MQPPIDPHIFRAYDIRGRVGTQLTADACLRIAKAFGSIVRERTKKEHPVIVVGRDARTHSPELCAAVIEGLMSTGCHVLDIGMSPSPLNYFTICTKQTDGGMQVTASHNPAPDNGLKLQLHDAEPFSGNELQTLRRRVEEGTFLEGAGSQETIDMTSEYRARQQHIFGEIGEGLSVVVDGGNGIAGPLACAVLRDLDSEVHELYTEPDGTFPNHPADPSKHTTLRELQQAVRENKANLGIAFDGDGDRLGIVDENGVIRTADEILLLLARDHLQRNPGKPIVFTVSNSGILETEVKKYGGEPVMCAVGHSCVEHVMREKGSQLGGEQSGHFFCAEEYEPFDDALYAALRVLAIAKAHGKPFSTLFADFPAVFQASERRPHCPDDRKRKIVEAATKFFATQYPVVTLDGVRIDFGDGAWAGIRQSNTSPCLSICIEARTEEKLEEVEEIVLGHMKTYEEIEWGEQ